MRIEIGNIMRKLADPIPLERKLSRDASATLLIHGLYQFGASMSGVFLNLYLWRLTHSLWINGMYFIIVFMLTPVGFAVAGWLSKKTDRLLSYRIGVVLTGLFYLMVVIAQEKVAEYYIYFAVGQSISGAFYWVAYLVLQYDVSTERNRIRYLSLNNVIFTFAGLAGPALAGFIISRFIGLHGYVIVFSIAFVMFFFTAMGSFSISAEHNSRKAYFLKFAGLMLKNNKAWRRSLYAYYMLCILQGLMSFLPNLLLFHVLPREDGVGYFGVLFSSLSIFVSYMMSKETNENRTFIYMLIAAVGFTLGTLILLWKVTLLTVVLYMIIYSSFNVLQGNMLATYFFRVTSQLPLKGRLRVESVVIREFFVNAGRVTSIFILILFTKSLDAGGLIFILLGATLLQFPIAWLIRSKKQEKPEGSA